MAQMTGGQAVVRSLLEHGVDAVFGLPGIHALPIYDALYDYPEIRHIEARHEQTIAYMADGYARATGKVGVCISTTGPGALNTAAAMGTAYADSSPVLNIMSQVESHYVDKHKWVTHEAQDQLGALRPLTRFSRRATFQNEISPAIRDYFKQVSSSRPGPGAIEICYDSLRNPAEADIVGAETAAPPTGDAAAIDRAAAIIAEARSPLIWCGGGVVSSGATAEVIRLAEYLQAPIITSIIGKSSVPENHPLVIGSSSWSQDIGEIVGKADAMVAIGTRFSADSTMSFQYPVPAKLVHIDIDPEEFGRNYPVAVGIHADAKVALARLFEALQSRRPAAEEKRYDFVRQTKDALNEAMRSRPFSALHTQLLDEMKPAFSKDAIFVTDMSSPCYTATRYLEVTEPRTFMSPTGFGTLGWGFPAALGVKVAKPDRQVICMVGDGAIHFALPEIITGVAFGINLVLVVFNDCSYSQLKSAQDHRYNGRYIACDLRNPDFVKVAKAYGARGIKVEKAAALRGAIEEASASDTITLIEVEMNKL